MYANYIAIISQKNKLIDLLIIIHEYVTYYFNKESIVQKICCTCSPLLLKSEKFIIVNLPSKVVIKEDLNMSISSKLHGYSLPSFLHLYHTYSETLTNFV